VDSSQEEAMLGTLSPSLFFSSFLFKLPPHLPIEMVRSFADGGNLSDVQVRRFEGGLEHLLSFLLQFFLRFFFFPFFRIIPLHRGGRTPWSLEGGARSATSAPLSPAFQIPLSGIMPVVSFRYTRYICTILSFCPINRFEARSYFPAPLLNVILPKRIDGLYPQ